jgi:3-oxoacyl-[acyl-carrier protein] reductase
MDLGLSGLTALVTGASGGIGRATAAALAQEGCRVALHAGRGAAPLAAWLADQPWRDRALIVTADVRDPAALDAAWREAEVRFGRVDVAVANAGVWPEAHAPLHTIDLDRVRDTVEVDLLGVLWTARAWMAGLARHPPRADGRGANLVLVGSTAGRFGEAGHVDYAACKAALHGVCLTLKNEVVHLDPHARVNLVEPGWTVTPMAEAALDAPGTIARVVRTMPLRQLARPEDIARAIAMLASPAASRHISGQTITVAGGMEGRVQWDEVDEAQVRRRLIVDNTADTQ